MVKSIFVFFFSLLTLTVFSQAEQDSVKTEEIHYNILQELHTPSLQGGNVRLSCDPAINNLVSLHTAINQKRKTFTGYRIQIYSASSYGCDIEQLKQMRDDFEKTFPDTPAYLKYIDPDFKIRVGNFRSRLECIPALHRIRKIYPSCYPVKTEISLQELERIPMQDIPLPEEDPTEED